MSGFPKYHELVCNSYSPDFTAGTEGCTLSSLVSSRRARLVAGGTFFRSVTDGSGYPVNSIILECIVTFVDTVGTVDTYDVVFKITDRDSVVTTIPTFQQKIDTGSPGGCVTNGIMALRTTLSSNPLVNMPEIDTFQPWNASSPAGSDADCLLTSFGPTNLSGGTAPPTASSSIRTGPAYTLYHIQQTENSVGTLVAADKIVEWDGGSWIDYPSTLYPAGSGSPALCGII